MMRLLHFDQNGALCLTKELSDEEVHSHPYAILSHTWGDDLDEVSFADLMKGSGETKRGYKKLLFCRDQAVRDGLQYFWVDSCCIDKSSSAELSKAITSMFRWYHNSVRCYAYLTDVSTQNDESTGASTRSWEPAFRVSRWFRRGWTLQELLAPRSVELFDMNHVRLGDKKSLEQLLHEVTDIPRRALRNAPLDEFSVEERMSWAKDRETKYGEDKAYSLLGLFGVSMLPNYGEGVEKAFARLQKEIQSDDFIARLPYAPDAPFNSRNSQHEATCLPDTRVDLLNDIYAWADGEGKQHIFWLSGLAGTGKSTVARSVAHWYDKRHSLGASFFFSRGGGDAGRAGKFVTSIAVQLARSVPGLRRHINNTMMQRPEIANQSLRDQWKYLVLEPLSKLESPAIFVLVVDALDECDGSNDTQLIMQLLAMCGSFKNVRLRVFLTSRHEVSIQHELGQLADTEHRNFVLHNVSSSVVDHDIRLFLQFRLNLIGQRDGQGLGWPGAGVIEGLLRRASGLFIWAAIACRFISEGLFAEERLDMLADGSDPESTANPEQHLNQLYLTVLEDCVQTSYTARELAKYHKMVRLILGSIVALYSPLSVLSLSALIMHPYQRVNRILQGMHAIIDIPRDQSKPLRLHHPSFRDFLFSKERYVDMGFRVHEQQAHMELASNCIQLLSSNLKQNICGIKAPGTRVVSIENGYVAQYLKPEDQYACVNWILHSVKAWPQLHDGHEVHIFLEEHFLHWLEALGWLGKLSEGIHAITALESIVPKSSRLQLFVDDMKRFALFGRAAIEQAPLQVYYSTLVYAPANSDVKQRFNHKLPECIKRVPQIDRDWDMLLQTLEGHSQSVSAVAFSPDGATIASASGDMTIKLWDASTGTEQHTLRGHSERVRAVVFSPDCNTVASASDDRTVKLWNRGNGVEQHTLRGHSDFVTIVVISPDGMTVASSSRDKTVRLWDVSTGNERQTLRGHLGEVAVVVFSPDGKKLASASHDGTVKLWDAGNGVEQHTLRGHSAMVTAVVFSPDSKTVVSASQDRTVKLWNTDTGNETQTLQGHLGGVTAVVVSPDSNMVASASHDGTVKLWDTSNGVEQHMLQGHIDWVKAVEFSPDSKTVASASYDRTVKLWDAGTGVKLRTLQGHSDTVKEVMFSPDGKTVASASSDKTVKLWKTGIDAQSQSFEQFDKVTALEFSPDGKTVASAHNDGTVKLWDAGDSTKQHTLQGHLDRITAVVFSSDSKKVASASYDGTVKLWDASNGVEQHTLRGHSDFVTVVVFSPDSKTVVLACNNNTVELWDVGTGTKQHMFQGHSDCVTAAVFSADSKTVVSAPDSWAVKLWDAGTGIEQQTLHGHSERVRAVVFSPDGKTVASVSYDRTVKLWDAKNGTELRSSQFDDFVSSLNFSDDGSRLITDYGGYSTPLNWDEQHITAGGTQNISVRGHWIYRGEENVIWLPPSHRPHLMAAHHNVAFFGYDTGTVTSIEFFP